MKALIGNPEAQYGDSNVIQLWDPWLTKQQVASRVQVEPRTVERWMQAGLPYVRFGSRPRFRMSQIEAYWADIQGENI
jgi:excisionase family DNA binding protein